MGCKCCKKAKNEELMGYKQPYKYKQKTKYQEPQNLAVEEKPINNISEPKEKKIEIINESDKKIEKVNIEKEIDISEVKTANFIQIESINKNEEKNKNIDEKEEEKVNDELGEKIVVNEKEIILEQKESNLVEKSDLKSVNLAVSEFVNKDSFRTPVKQDKPSILDSLDNSKVKESEEKLAISKEDRKKKIEEIIEFGEFGLSQSNRGSSLSPKLKDKKAVLNSVKTFMKEKSIASEEISYRGIDKTTEDWLVDYVFEKDVEIGNWLEFHYIGTKKMKMLNKFIEKEIKKEGTLEFSTDIIRRSRTTVNKKELDLEKQKMQKLKQKTKISKTNIEQNIQQSEKLEKEAILNLKRGQYENSMKTMTNSFSLAVVCEPNIEENPIYIQKFNVMSTAMARMGRYREAFELTTRSIISSTDISTKTKEKEQDSLEAAKSLANFSEILLPFGYYSDSLKYCQKALQIKNKLFQKNHPEILECEIIKQQCLLGNGNYTTVEKESEEIMIKIENVKLF